MHLTEHSQPSASTTPSRASPFRECSPYRPLGPSAGDLRQQPKANADAFVFAQHQPTLDDKPTSNTTPPWDTLSECDESVENPFRDAPFNGSNTFTALNTPPSEDDADNQRSSQYVTVDDSDRNHSVEGAPLTESAPSVIQNENATTFGDRRLNLYEHGMDDLY